MSISKSFKLRRPSSIRTQFILSSFIWELKVFIVSFNHAFQLKIPSVIIFKIAFVAIESWTKYVLYFLTHSNILLWPSPHSTNELINFVHLHVQGQKSDFNMRQLPGKLPFHRVFHRFWPCENTLFTVFEPFYPATRNIVCTEDCCNVNK